MDFKSFTLTTTTRTWPIDNWAGQLGVTWSNSQEAETESNVALQRLALAT